MDARFDQPVLITLGKAERRRAINSVQEAVRCLRSDQWPAPPRPLARIAASALDGAYNGHVTAGEARQAFIDAALEARVLVLPQMVH